MFSDMGVFSVPWVVLDGVPVATDPLEPELVISLVKGRDLGGFVPEEVEGAMERFIKGVFASAYAFAVVAVHGSLHPLLSTDFPVVASRVRLSHGLNVSDVVSALRVREGEVLEVLMDKVPKVLAKNFVREGFWGGARDYAAVARGLSVESVAAWHIGKASIGRGGIPTEFEQVREAAHSILRVLDDRGRRYWEDIVEEQGKIMGDTEYRIVLRNVMGSTARK